LRSIFFIVIYVLRHIPVDNQQGDKRHRGYKFHSLTEDAVDTICNSKMSREILLN
jgi:hypothetical protein